MSRFANFAIILGAGASKGGMVGRTYGPPLDMEFLNEAAEIFSRRRNVKSGGRDWQEFKRNLDSAGLQLDRVRNWRMEVLSTYLEARIRVNYLQENAGRPASYRAALHSLKRVICRTLASTGGTRSCKLHKRLFEATNTQAVVSFNYDMIADQSLCELNSLSWGSTAYCGDRQLDIISSGGKASRRRILNGQGRGRVHLYKLHGSMHWREHQMRGREAFMISGVESPPNPQFNYCVPPERPLIVPPVAAKMEIQTSLRPVWQKARSALSNSPGWIFWGYSFPQTDTAATILFRTALFSARRRNPKSVVVINPDPSTQDRIRQNLGKIKIAAYYPSVERLLMEMA